MDVELRRRPQAACVSNLGSDGNPLNSLLSREIDMSVMASFLVRRDRDAEASRRGSVRVITAGPLTGA